MPFELVSLVAQLGILPCGSSARNSSPNEDIPQPGIGGSEEVVGSGVNPGCGSGLLREGVAESEGFEPPVPLRVRLISRLAYNILLSTI